MTWGDGEDKSQGSSGYLRGLLGDGARPFLFRERVCSLLGDEGGWSGPAKGGASHRPVGLPYSGALRAAPPGRGPGCGPGCGKRLLSGDVEAGRGGDSLDTRRKSVPGGNGGTHGPGALRQGGEADIRRPADDGRGRAPGACAMGAGSGRQAGRPFAADAGPMPVEKEMRGRRGGREGKDGERLGCGSLSEGWRHEPVRVPAAGAGEENPARGGAEEKEREFLCHGPTPIPRTATAGDGRGAKGGSPSGEKGRTAEHEAGRRGAAGQAAKTDTIVIPGGAGERGALHPVASGALQCGPSPVAADGTEHGAVRRNLKGATQEGAVGGHGGGFARSSMAQRVAPGRGAAEPARSGREKICETGAAEPEQRIAATSGTGFDAARGGERRPRLAMIPGGLRGMFAAMGEGASFMEESSLPRGEERNMAGALRTLEDHLRQKIEQLRETSARRPDSTAAHFAPDTASAGEAGEAPRVLPARERIVIVGRAPRRSAAPAAFWERSYMGRLFLRPLR